MAKESITGSCLCKAVTYTSKGEAEMAVECFCEDCRRLSGAVSLPQLCVPKGEVEVAGSLQSYKIEVDSGENVECSFCGICGSLIHKATSRFPDRLFLTVGTFDDTSRFEPGTQAYSESQPAWDKASA